MMRSAVAPLLLLIAACMQILPTCRSMAMVRPPECVGVVGRGFISVLSAKLSAVRGHDTWMICPAGEEDVIRSLLYSPSSPPLGNLEIISANDSDRVEERLTSTAGLIVAVDASSTMDQSVLSYLLDPELSSNLKRVVGMSRNLNGKDMGFFVRASKLSANSEVWDNGAADEYRSFESILKSGANKLGADCIIARAGTLKGGGCGTQNENDGCHHPQFLTSKYYEMTKKDIVTWQLLFDCNARGVRLEKRDVMPGPGAKAIFTATGTEGGLAGDTSRGGLAEAMVRSLGAKMEVDAVDFGVGTTAARSPPSDSEWDNMFLSIFQS